MSEEEIQEEVEQEPEVEQELEQEAEQEGESESERQARAQGWAPKEEWRGPEDQWVDADTFLERGQKNNAILRERNEKLFNEIQSLKDELRSSVKEFGEAQRKTEERAYNQAMQDLKARQKEAVELGDVESWEKLESHKQQLEQAKPQQPQQQYNPDTDPAFISWLPKNDWYNPQSDNYDVDASAYAEQIAPAIARKFGGGQEFYEKISEHVKQKFPEKFGNPRRSRPSPVEGATSAGGKQKKGKSYDDLPPEAKSTCDRYVEQGLMKKDEYVKEYFSQ